MTQIRRVFCGAMVAVALSTLALAGTASLIPINSSLAAPSPSQADLLQPPPLGNHQLGPDNAPITIIEYGSLTCPHCAHFENEVFPKLKKKYIDTGKVRYFYRQFALNPLDEAAIMLSQCVANDKFFPFVEALYRTQDSWEVDKPLGPLFEIAKQVGFTKESFDACLKNQKLLEKVEKQRDEAGSLFGVNSTPTFFVNGTKHLGAMEFDALEKILKPYLTEK